MQVKRTLEKRREKRRRLDNTQSSDEKRGEVTRGEGEGGGQR